MSPVYHCCGRRSSQMRLAEIMRACVLFLLRLTHLQGLQSPTESERVVFLMWECLKLFGHLLMYFHKSGLEGQRTTTTGRKHIHWKVRISMGVLLLFCLGCLLFFLVLFHFFFLLQRKQMQVNEKRNAVSNLLTFEYSNA